MGHSCHLINSAFGWFLQFVLGFIAISCLIYKRHVERPRRSWLIWGSDVSKQAIAAIIAHFMNVGLGVSFSESSGTDSDECSWYAVNFTFDVVLGGALCIILLRATEWLVSFKGSCTNGCSGFIGKSGAYPQKHFFKAYLAQLAIWVAILCLSKGFLASFLYFIRKPMDDVANSVFEPIQDHPKSELAVVMVLWPLVLNAIYFWLIDFFLKADDEKYHFGRCCNRHHGVDSHGEQNGGTQVEDHTDRPAPSFVSTGGVTLTKPLLNSNAEPPQLHHM